ncbi:hypothetical protein OSB04_022089 [Centaurea solstitialis]|uniref:Receptor-like serine/threonine-protein kinase n=1 Tax=Centaurea solstitialis TaxID=347529 RepID=A0AA38WID2_9ASTR|nr:hypothetical protein OSB04_022089 [Centaurea solstitialis]
MWVLLLLYLSLAVCISSGADTLYANQSLSGDQTLVSKGENFVLGFFKPGNSSNYYIGIWYKKVTSNPPTIVWVANRKTPVSDRFKSALRIVDGNLVLLNESNFQIWSTNVSTTRTNLNADVVIIRDDGNLVLTDQSNSVEIWQSFDHPVDTWLPGAKLGYDNITKKSQLLTSWKGRENPDVGLFSLVCEPSEKTYISKWNNSISYWSSGSWNGKIFSLVPEMRLNYIYNFSFFSNENESYFTYSVYDSSIISRFIMDTSGQVQQQTWLEAEKQWNIFWSQPKTQCQVYAICGSFGICSESGLPFCNCLTGFKPRSENDWNQSDFSGGCVSKTDLQCGRNMESLDFFMITVKDMPPNSSVADGSSGECRTNCLNNCSCKAYSFVDNQCSVWDGDLLNLSELDTNGKTIYVKVASKDLPRPKKSKGVALSTVVGSVAGVVFVLGLIVLIIYRRKRRLAGKTTMEGLLVSFVYRDLQTATKNFSDKLGGGGFGSVFKGVLRDSSVVAVKKLESMSQGEKQFRSEVSTIGTTQHVHLVRLRGFCAEGNNKLLVYDYMPNGSLDSHLFHEKPVLNWKTRYEIALGTARGLVYLHEKCRDCIIHCDIKPENILLDADFCPKIADFGLAKLVGRDFSRVLTTLRGTRGYLAPEWLSGVAVTAKADVFSYGMLLFELVNGKRNAERSVDLRGTFFPYLAASVVMVGGDILSLLDSRLNREADIEEVTKICKVAFWCIQDEEESRPSMSVVEQILEGVLDVNMPPIPRSIKLYADNTEHLVFFTESSSQGSSQEPSSSSSSVPQSKSASS